MKIQKKNLETVKQKFSEKTNHFNERKVLKTEGINYRRYNQKKKDHFLDFLAIETKLLSDKSYEIILHFAGDKLIKINTEVIDCFLDDQGEPWETKNKPKHDIFDE